jgi:hypothetical protein
MLCWINSQSLPQTDCKIGHYQNEKLFNTKNKTETSISQTTVRDTKRSIPYRIISDRDCDNVTCRGCVMNTRLANVIAELDALTTTMELVKKHNKPLRMIEYAEDSVLFEEAKCQIADCGTPCCVAGYHALRIGEYSNMGDVPLAAAVNYWVTWSKPDVPRSLVSLSQIIFGGDTVGRSETAANIQFPDWQDYPHITDKTPTPDDTLTLIRDIKSWLLEKYND